MLEIPLHNTCITLLLCYCGSLQKAFSNTKTVAYTLKYTMLLFLNKHLTVADKPIKQGFSVFILYGY